jgi:hypothetical protein
MPVDISIARETPARRGLLGLGHGISTTFHVTALYFGAAYLLITIPVHLIYAAVALAKQDGSVRRRNMHALSAERTELVTNSTNATPHG